MPPIHVWYRRYVPIQSPLRQKCSLQMWTTPTPDSTHIPINVSTLNQCTLFTTPSSTQNLISSPPLPHLTWGSLLRAPGHSLPLPTFPPVAYPALALPCSAWTHSGIPSHRCPESKKHNFHWIIHWSSITEVLSVHPCRRERLSRLERLFLIPEAASLRVGWTRAAAEQPRLVRMPEGESWALPFCFPPPSNLILSASRPSLPLPASYPCNHAELKH